MEAPEKYISNLLTSAKKMQNLKENFTLMMFGQKSLSREKKTLNTLVLMPLLKRRPSFFLKTITERNYQ